MTALSRRELAVLTLASQGFTRDESATRLGTKPETVKNQSYSARRKLRARNTAHAVAIALREELIP